MPGAPRPKGAPERVVALPGTPADEGTLRRFNELFGLRR
jgi:iron(III) transport system substrate-binding protein